MKTKIKGVARPSGEIYSFEECRKRNKYIEAAVDEMRTFAEEFAAREGLRGTIFIRNTTGHDRDSCTMGFEYPTSKKMEDRLNWAYTAKGVEEWASGLPTKSREVYLREANAHAPLAEWLSRAIQTDQSKTKSP